MVPSGSAAPPEELSEIRRLYETRIKALEIRIESLERPPQEQAVVADVAIPEAPAVQEKPNDFNPSIGVVLVGTASSFSRDNDFTVPGFMLGADRRSGCDRSAGTRVGGGWMGNSGYRGWQRGAGGGIDSQFRAILAGNSGGAHWHYLHTGRSCLRRWPDVFAVV